MTVENIYSQSDAESESEAAKERKQKISTRANRAAAMRRDVRPNRRSKFEPKLVFIGAGSALEQMGRIRLTRRYSGNIE